MSQMYVTEAFTSPNMSCNDRAVSKTSPAERAELARTNETGLCGQAGTVWILLLRGA